MQKPRLLALVAAGHEMMLGDANGPEQARAKRAGFRPHASSPGLRGEGLSPEQVLHPREEAMLLRMGLVRGFLLELGEQFLLPLGELLPRIC